MLKFVMSQPALHLSCHSLHGVQTHIPQRGSSSDSLRHLATMTGAVGERNHAAATGAAATAATKMMSKTASSLYFPTVWKTLKGPFPYVSF